MRGILIPDVASSGALLDGRVLAIAVAVALVGGVLTALLPALQSTSPDLVGALKSGAREGGGRRSITRSALVVAQAALSLVLLVGAGLFLRSLHKARAVDLGYVADRVLTVDLDLTGAGYSNEQAIALHEQLHERLARLPGVQHASIGMSTPFATTLDINFELPGRDSVPLPPSGAPRVNVVTPEFFATMGTRVVQGRAIAPDDRRGAPPVTVINRTMARTLWPGRSPIGQCIILPDEDGKPCVEVVGVAEDARWSDLRDDPPMQMYFAMAQDVFEFPLRVLFLRVAGDPAPVIEAVRREVREAAPRVLFAEVEPLAANIEPEVRPWRLGATMFTIFGALALVLAGLGLSSVIAYDVAQRVREMGIRIALGARAGDILRLVVGQGIRMAALGVALGAAIALAAGRWVGDLLFDTSPTDPLVLGAVVAVLLTVAAAACLLPARRATRVPPDVALRSE